MQEKHEKGGKPRGGFKVGPIEYPGSVLSRNFVICSVTRNVWILELADDATSIDDGVVDTAPVAVDDDDLFRVNLELN